MKNRKTFTLYLDITRREKKNLKKEFAFDGVFLRCVACDRYSGIVVGKGRLVSYRCKCIVCGARWERGI